MKEEAKNEPIKMENITIADLPKSTIKVTRMPLN